jgi:GntR family transcriptional regulator / MocR family aminotransferase
VIYIGNFSKTIVPSLRIGYLVLPPALVEDFKKVRAAMSRQPPGVDQAILAEFIREGHLERHIRATLRVYQERQEALVQTLKEEANGLLETSPTRTGMYLIGWLNPGVDDSAVAKAAAADGVDVIPLSAFSLVQTRRRGIVLGYSGYDVNRIRSAAKRLSTVLSRLNRSTLAQGRA